MTVYLNTNKNLKPLIDNYEKYFLTLSETINLPKKWDQFTAFEIEIKKSFIRGMLRYSENTLNILNFIKNYYEQNLIKSNELNWITLPYPMIHLPNDLMEDGGFHYDETSKKNLFTCWIPITDYKYKALSILKFRSKILNRFFQLLIKTDICKYFSDHIEANKGNIFLWDGNQLHSGNRNISDTPSCAIQLKLVNQIYRFEQNKNFSSNFTIENKNFKDLNHKQILNEYKLYHKYIELIMQNNNQINLKAKLEKILSTINNPSYPLSFSLSLLAQRMMSKKKYFKQFQDLKNVLICMDKLSLSLGSANLVSLNRLLNLGKKNKEIENELKEIDKFKLIPFDTYQYYELLKKGNKNNLDTFSY